MGHDQIIWRIAVGKKQRLAVIELTTKTRMKGHRMNLVDRGTFQTMSFETAIMTSNKTNQNGDRWKLISHTSHFYQNRKSSIPVSAKMFHFFFNYVNWFGNQAKKCNNVYTHQ